MNQAPDGFGRDDQLICHITHTHTRKNECRQKGKFQLRKGKTFEVEYYHDDADWWYLYIHGDHEIKPQYCAIRKKYCTVTKVFGRKLQYPSGCV